MIDTINSFLSFKVGSEFYAANVSYVHNIIEYTEITKMPETPSFMLGIINLRGIVLPVIDTRNIFGLNTTQITINTCILVMEVKIEDKMVFVGAVVDEVAEVMEIGEQEIKEPPKIGTSIHNDFISGIYHDNDKFIMILEVNKIFASNEILNIKEISGSMSA